MSQHAHTGGGTATRQPPTRINWGDAFALFLALGPTERTLQRVADAFPVSYARVKQVAKRDSWWDRAAAVDAAQREKQEQEAIRSLDERNRETIRVVDQARINYLSALRGDDPLVPAGRDLAALLRIEQLIEGEATDRVEIREVRELVLRVLSEQDSALRVILDGDLANGNGPAILSAFRDRTREIVERVALGSGE